MITPADVDAYIAEEARWGISVSRERAERFLRQRERLSACAPVRQEPPLQYEDSYGNLRWSDNHERVTGRR